MKNSSAVVLLGIAGVFLSLAVAYDTYCNRQLTTQLAASQESVVRTTQALQELGATTTLLYTLLASSTAENEDLSTRLGLAVSDNTSLSQQVVASQSFINVLTKLRTTDKELLQKYSKVYFLNENYTPSSLATIAPDLVFDKKKTLQFHTQVLPKLVQMMNQASAAGHDLSLISAYRSFKDQTSLKNQYTVTYGKGANAFSADQGYSEHQLGTTVDFTTPTLGNNYSSFDASGAYDWLIDNAWRYGFVESYPKNNGYYVYEPWHWRYVGVSLATVLHQNNKNFYDLDQREIDEFLIDFFN